MRVLALLPRKFKNGNSVRWAARILTKHPLASAGVVARCACVAFWCGLRPCLSTSACTLYIHRFKEVWGNGAERPRLVPRPSVGDGVPETLDGKNPAVYLVNYFQFSSVSPDQSTTRLYGFTPPAVCALSGVRVGSELASVARRQAVLRLYFLVKP